MLPPCTGNLRTSDMRGPNGGTYNLSLLSTQEAGIQAAVAFKGNYSDLDIVHFLTNVECLEGLFDTYGAFGRGCELPACCCCYCRTLPGSWWPVPVQLQGRVQSGEVQC